MDVGVRLDRLTFRRARARDALAMALGVRAGFETYRDWAGPGWEPPDIASRAEVARLRDRLEGTASWARLACDGDELAGHVFVESGRELEPPYHEIPRLAHLAHLFVAREWWGTGLAPALLGEAVERMRATGFEEGRLWTPSGQRRARAFYAREGWRETGSEWFDEGLRLVLVELRIGLG
jgi:GNAT superfamily N-acetyltransferase